MRVFVFSLAFLISVVAYAQDQDQQVAPGADLSSEKNDDTEALDDYIAEEAETYETVVEARRPIEKDDTQDTVTIDGDVLRNSSQNSTLEAISRQDAGVYVTGRGAQHGVANGASGGIHIRGLGGSPNSQVLVVEDGTPDYQGIFGHPIPDAYVPFLIDDVMVVKGGDSVLYGTNALGGVIVIRNRWRTFDGVEFQNDASVGSFSTLKESLSMLSRHHRLDAAVSFMAFHSKGHRPGAGGDTHIGHTGFRYRLTDKWRLDFRNKVIHLQGQDPGPVTHPNVDHWYDVWRNNTSAEISRKGTGLRFSFHPYVNFGVHRLYDGFHSIDYVSGAHSEFDWTISNSLKLLTGVNLQHVDGQVENRITHETMPVSSMTDVALYHQLSYAPADHLKLVLGSREMYSLIYGFHFFYKAGFRWDVIGDLFLKSSIKRNYRQPTLRELYLPFPTANDDLKPETAVNADVSLGYEARRFNASVSGYRTEARQMIKYFGSWPTSEVVNIDRITIWGIEGQIGFRELGPMHSQVSLDLRDVGRYSRQNPELKMNGTIGYSRKAGNRQFDASVEGHWVHGIYMENYQRGRIPDVATVDVTLRYRHQLAYRQAVLEPYLFLRNLLNADYAYVEHYPMPGFNVMAGLKIGL